MLQQQQQTNWHTEARNEARKCMSLFRQVLFCATSESKPGFDPRKGGLGCLRSPGHLSPVISGDGCSLTCPEEWVCHCPAEGVCKHLGNCRIGRRGTLPCSRSNTYPLRPHMRSDRTASCRSSSRWPRRNCRRRRMLHEVVVGNFPFLPARRAHQGTGLFWRRGRHCPGRSSKSRLLLHRCSGPNTSG